MKSLPRCAGQGAGGNEKLDVQNSVAKYWGTLTLTGKRIVRRSDGSTSVDKTRGWHSRPGNKESLRNANRAINKRARQILKRQMLEAVDVD